MRISEAARYLKMSVIGVRTAANEGRLPCTVSASGHRIFQRADLDRYLGRDPALPAARPRVEALYCRVSGGGDQLSSLAHQESELRSSAAGPVHRVYKDQASGLNERRKALELLLDDAAEGKFTVVRVTHADRLARFGIPYIERLLKLSGVTVEVLHEHGDASLHDELMRDFMGLTSSFSGRFYRLRSRDNQLKLLAQASEDLRNKQAGDTP